MRALVYHGPEDIRCESVPDPTPPDSRGAVLKVERASICGSDLHLYHGTFAGVEPGLVVGHEFVGEVVETGSAVQSIRPGDRVLVSATVGCGNCPRCLQGQVVRCQEGLARVFGTQNALPGGQAEAVAVPGADHAMRKIPEGISVEQAVLLTDILPTGFFGARMAGIQPGQDVAVVGLGPVGVMAVLCAQLWGPARIFAIDQVPERLARAKELGAIPVAADEADRVLGEASAGQGMDAVIEAVGAEETITRALLWVRAGGTVSMVGVNVRMDLPFPMGLAFMKDITFRTGLVPVPEFWTSLIPLVESGRLAPETVFTHRMALSEGRDAYRLFAERGEGVLKVLLDTSL